MTHIRITILLNITTFSSHANCAQQFLFQLKCRLANHLSNSKFKRPFSSSFEVMSHVVRISVFCWRLIWLRSHKISLISTVAVPLFIVRLKSNRSTSSKFLFCPNFRVIKKRFFFQSQSGLDGEQPSRALFWAAETQIFFFMKDLFLVELRTSVWGNWISFKLQL